MPAETRDARARRCEEVVSEQVTIGVRYSCAGCGLREIQLDVPARGNEAVVVWMDATVRRLSADHRRRSPNCNAQALQEVKIPMTGVDRIGGPSIQ